MTPVTIDKDKVAKNALRYIQKGQFQRAIEEYRKVLSSDPRDIRVRLKLVDLYGRIGKKKEAVDECVQVAESYADQGFYLKAVAVYKQAVRIDPENPGLFQSMGDLYAKQGLFGDALGCFKRGAQLLRHQGKNDDAERLLSRMADLAPGSASVRVALAELYLAEGKLAAFEAELDRLVAELGTGGRLPTLLRALETFRRGAERHSPLLDRLTRLSERFRRTTAGERPLRPPEAASSAGCRALPEALLEVDLFVKYGLEDRAAAALETLALEVPEDVAVRRRLRDLRERVGDRAAWIREQMVLSDLHLRTQEWREAAAALEAVLRAEPEHEEARAALRRLRSNGAPGVPGGLGAGEPTEAPAAGWGELEGGLGAGEPAWGASRSEPGGLVPELDPSGVSEVDEIVREFKSGIAEQIDANDHDTHYNLGMAYKEMGLLDDALEEFRIASRSPERSREAYTCMALVYRESERFADARAALKMALATSGNTPDDEVAILFELGTLAEDERDWDGALQAFAKASAIDSAYRDLPRRLELLQARRGG